MENSFDASAGALNGMALLWLVAGLVGLGVARATAARRVGRALARERHFGWPRRAFVVLHAAALVAVIAQWSAFEALPTFVALTLSAALMFASPQAHDADIGERGVRRGWVARAYTELEEWRLTGDHLRWKAGGEWHACPAPRASHPQLRARLVAACPERESRFTG